MLWHKVQGAGGNGGRDAVALTNTMTTPDGKWVVGDTVAYSKLQTPTYSFSPASVTFPVRNGEQFRIKLYGGSGGSIGSAGAYGGNSNGSTMDATVNLLSFQDGNLYIYFGGAGQNSSTSIDGSTGRPYGRAGQNGGGAGGGSRGPSGGGRTDLRRTTSNLTEILVASGGGGGYGNYSTISTRVQGQAGRSGYVGSYPADNGGGGGGYYGGSASQQDDGSNGGSGTNYSDSTYTTTVHQNTRISGTSGGNQGTGYFEIEVISIS